MMNGLNKMKPVIAGTALSLGLACHLWTPKFHEEAAIASMRDIRDAEAHYKSGKGGGRYGSLQELAQTGLIDSSLGSGTYQGYRYTIRVNRDSYEAVAVPIKYSDSTFTGTGALSLYLDDSGVIRGNYHQGAEANKKDGVLPDSEP